MSWNQTPLPPLARADGYVNVLNKYGTSQDNSTSYQFGNEPVIPDMQLTNQYEVDGLFAKIIDAPSEEAVRHGFSLGLKESSAEEYVTKMLEKLAWEDRAATAIKWARLYGGALGVMLIDDGGDIDQPLNWKRIRDIDEIRIYERAVVWPDYSSLYNYDQRNPVLSTNSKFGMPEYYFVQSIYGQFWVHESRCLIFRNSILPERTMNPYYRYWGMPEYARIKRELRETATTHGNAVKLLERSVQAIYGMQGLARLLATDEGENEVIKRLQVIDMARGLLNSIAIDSEGESYEFKTASLAGVKEVVDSTCNMLSAVTNIPQTILFGRSPAGMNSTGQADLENYYNYIERIQKLMLRDNLNTLLGVIVKAGLSQRKLEEEPAINLSFSPLWSMSETEQTQVQREKAQTAHIKAQTAQLYVDIGALDPSDIRKGLAAENEYEIEALLDDITEEELMLAWESGDANPDKQSMSKAEGDAASVATPNNAIRSDADEDTEWITVNGTPVPLDENGEMTGAVADKINQNTVKKKQAKTSEKPLTQEVSTVTMVNEKLTESTIFSASGANPNIQPMTKKSLNKHWGGARDHSQQYPEYTKAQYADKALELARSATSETVLGYRAANGSIVRYDKRSNDFVKSYWSGVSTMYKPDDGEKYFKRAMKREGGKQDD